MDPNDTPRQERTARSYDEMPYVPASFAQSHPDRLAVLARLFGLATPAIETCRVLELGCAAGDNLVPMAFGLPQARFVGVDLSERQIARGRELIDELGLRNIELRAGSLAEVDASWGSFDYIVCHGVYSWVPEPIRARILAICGANLAPAGVAYVSYNTLPGWRIRGMIRDMMVYHADQFADAGAKVSQARSLLEFLARSASGDSVYARALAAEHESIRNKVDAYVLHEYLDEFNDAVYFHQFAAAARGHGLHYLGEARFMDMMVSNFPPQVAETLRRIAPDLIRMEQYMDFVRNRAFRQTLLVREGVAIRRRLDWRVLRDCLVASAARPPADKPALAPDARESFTTEAGSVITLSHAIAKAAMRLLAEQWPRAIAFQELVSAAGGRLQAQVAGGAAGAPPASDEEVLGVTLLQCYAAGGIELHVWPSSFAAVPSSRPRASALARACARRDTRVPNLWHETVRVDGLPRALLDLVDGTRDRPALVAEVAAQVRRGLLHVRHPQTGEPLIAGQGLELTLGGMLDDSLSTLTRLALLIE